MKHAILKLKPIELEQLDSRLEHNCPPPIDARTEADLAAARLDHLLLQALEDEKNGNFRPL